MILNALSTDRLKAKQSENSVKAYVVNWAGELDTDTISTSTWSSEDNITIASESNTNTTASCTVTGRPGFYRVVNTITTASETLERIIELTITPSYATGYTPPLLPVSGVMNIASSTYSVDEGAGSVTIAVNRTSNLQFAGTVDYATSDGTATAGTDYTSTSGTLTFAVDVATQYITIPILENTDAEVDETFTVTLSNPSSGISLGTTTSTTVTITDNDPAHELILDDMTGFAKAWGVTGGKGGTVVTVTNSNASGAGSLKQALLDASGPTWIKFTASSTWIITLTGLANISTNDITIDGRGADITIDDYGIQARQNAASPSLSNYVLTHLKFTSSLGTGLGFVNNVEGIWTNKCTFTSSGGQTSYKQTTIAGDTYPPARDATLSYCKFSGGFGALLGASATQAVDTDITCTIEHTFFDGVNERCPLLRYGKAHIYNSYIYNWQTTAASASQDGQMYSEGNVYEDGANTDAGKETFGLRAGTLNVGDTTDGHAASVNDVFLGTATLDSSVDGIGVFNPTTYYTDTVSDPTGDSGAALKADITTNAGWQNDAFPT